MNPLRPVIDAGRILWHWWRWQCARDAVVAQQRFCAVKEAEYRAAHAGIAWCEQQLIERHRELCAAKNNRRFVLRGPI